MIILWDGAEFSPEMPLLSPASELTRCRFSGSVELGNRSFGEFADRAPWEGTEHSKAISARFSSPSRGEVKRKEANHQHKDKTIARIGNLTNIVFP
jgi:hypothetical protein